MALASLAAITLHGAGALGCGGAPIRQRTRAAPDTVVPEQVGGRALLVVRRPLERRVAVSVWFDAGTLDASNASVALVAAEMVAASRGGVRASVLPDGMVFRRLCSLDDLESCVGELATQLAVIEISEEAWTSARARVDARRARGLGSAQREAETLATSAALGIPLAPLGDSTDVVSRDDVTRFVDAHLGTERSLWIAIGDVDAQRLGASLARAPRREASASRATRRVDESAAREHAEERHDAGAWALARRVPDEASATSLAHAWSMRSSLVGELSVAAFPTRAGWVALVSFASDASPAVGRWSQVEPWPTSDATEGDAWSIADRAGARWVAGEVSDATPREGLAFAGRDAEQHLAAARETSFASAPWRDEARIVIEGTDDVAVAWALPGPDVDGAADLGATSIAAAWLSARCAPDAQVEVRGDAVVVSAVGEASVVRAHASLWRDCVALAPPSSVEVELARRRVLSRVDANAERARLAAQWIAPTRPGLVAPEPDLRSISDVDTGAVLERWASWRDAGRWALAGDVTASDVGAPPASSAPIDGPSVVPERVSTTLDAMERLVTVTLPHCASVGMADALRAAWLAHARRSGVTISWSTSGSAGGLTWFATTGRGEATALAAWESAGGAITLDSLRSDAARVEAEAAVVLADPRAVAIRAAMGSRPGGACTSAPRVVSVWLDPPIASRRR